MYYVIAMISTFSFYASNTSVAISFHCRIHSSEIRERMCYSTTDPSHTLGSRWSHNRGGGSSSWTCSVEIREDVLLIHEINSSPRFWMEMEPGGPVTAMTLHRGPARVHAQPHGSGLYVHTAEGEGVDLAARRPDSHHDSGGPAGS
jgi:hypothetical protein